MSAQKTCQNRDDDCGEEAEKESTPEQSRSVRPSFKERMLDYGHIFILIVVVILVVLGMMLSPIAFLVTSCTHPQKYVRYMFFGVVVLYMVYQTTSFVIALITGPRAVVPAVTPTVPPAQ